MERYKNNKLNEDGFLILQNVISHDDCKKVVGCLERGIENCAQDLQLNSLEYLSVINRWKHPSPIMESFEKTIRTHIEHVVSNILSTKLVHISSDVICKPARSQACIPCHQDLPYAVRNPYNFSVWIALSDVSLSSGPLEVLPESHREKVGPLVDFWRPNFEDRMRHSTRWQQNNLSLPIQAGDGILFDSCLWHGSSKNQDTTDRFAFVTRWKLENSVFLNQIPSPNPSSFGMQNCGAVTHSLLQKGLSLIFQEDVDSFLPLIITWIEKLQGDSAIALNHKAKALTALVHLRDLTKSSQLHNAGDSQGFIYRNVWHYFLQDLNAHIQTIEKVGSEN